MTLHQKNKLLGRLCIKKETTWCEHGLYCMRANRVSNFTTFTPVVNLVPQRSRFLAVFHLCLLWSQVLNPVSTLPGPCPWNWNFLVYHRVPFQQACTQLSFNHSPRSYRCVWSKYKVSLSWVWHTGDVFSRSGCIHEMFSRVEIRWRLR